MKRIILVGKAASGKDHARKSLIKFGANYAVSYTTRPPREDETDNVDYYFITPNEFEYMISKDKMYEYVEFNGWYYGTTNKQMDECDLFIMTPLGLSHLTKEDRQESFVIYFDIPEDIRRERMAERKGNADSIDRRIEADEKDFADFENFDLKIDNPNYTDEEVLIIYTNQLILNKKRSRNTRISKN